MKKAYRIKKSSEIETLMKQKSSVGNSAFALYYTANLEQPHFRFAISVPKKYGNAVERNQIKRRIREIVHQTPGFGKIDFFVVVKTKANTLAFSEVKDNLEKLFARAKIIEG